MAYLNSAALLSKIIHHKKKNLVPTSCSLPLKGVAILREKSAVFP